MPPRTRKDGTLLTLQPSRGLFKESDLEHKREYVRHVLDKPIQSRRPLPVRAGEDPLEQRASHSVDGSILERIVYKKLQQLLGPEGVRWQFKKGLLGARQFIGGFELGRAFNNPAFERLVQGFDFSFRQFAFGNIFANTCGADYVALGIEENRIAETNDPFGAVFHANRVFVQSFNLA